MRAPIRLSIAFLLLLGACTTTPNDPGGDQLASPVLKMPANGATQVAQTPTLTWMSVTGARTYRIQVSTKQDFSTILYDTIWSVTAKETPFLPGKTNYYWHVRVEDSTKLSAWSDTWKFTTLDVGFRTPGLGSTFTLFEYYEKEGVWVPVDTVRATVLEIGQSRFGRENVLVFSGFPPISYAPSGDIGIYADADGTWLDLPFGTRQRSYRKETIQTDFERSRTTEFIGNVPVKIGARTFDALRVQVLDTTFNKSKPSDGGREYFDWIPELGFFGRSQDDSWDLDPYSFRSGSDLRLESFELK
jgi:hypothetical protein